MTLNYGNQPVASFRKDRLYRFIFVGFGLLCILQATCNISLQLALCSSDERIPDFEAIIKNLTKEGDDLKKKLNIFDSYSRQGWVYFHHSFYYISSLKKSWQDSRDDCLQRGADLIIINNKEEQDFAQKFKQLTWIGMSDTETEGVWRWVDGTELITSYWKSGEPNNYKGYDEDCGEIKHFDSEYGWNDLPCTKENFWICEKEVAI